MRQGIITFEAGWDATKKRPFTRESSLDLLQWKSSIHECTYKLAALICLRGDHVYAVLRQGDSLVKMDDLLPNPVLLGTVTKHRFFDVAKEAILFVYVFDNDQRTMAAAASPRRPTPSSPKPGAPSLTMQMVEQMQNQKSSLTMQMLEQKLGQMSVKPNPELQQEDQEMLDESQLPLGQDVPPAEAMHQKSAPADIIYVGSQSQQQSGIPSVESPAKKRQKIGKYLRLNFSTLPGHGAGVASQGCRGAPAVMSPDGAPPGSAAPSAATAGPAASSNTAASCAQGLARGQIFLRKD